MSMNDPIADLLTRIRNGQAAGKPEVSVQSSRVKEAIVRVLKDEGYVTDFVVSRDGGRSTLVIALKYHQRDGSRIVNITTRMSASSGSVRNDESMNATSMRPGPPSASATRLPTIASFELK